jgi:hypothetical protein
MATFASSFGKKLLLVMDILASSGIATGLSGPLPWRGILLQLLPMPLKSNNPQLLRRNPRRSALTASPPISLVGGFLGFIVLVLCAPPSHGSALITGPWAREVAPRETGPFPYPGDFSAEFVFGWSNVPAGQAEFVLRRSGGGRYRAEFSGRTTGLARRLWQADITYQCSGLVRGLQTIDLHQIEEYRRHRIDMKATFTPEGVRRIRQRIPSPDEAYWRNFALPGLRDILGAMLFVHSQPLRPGDQIVTLCYPGDAPYLVRIKVADPELVSWQTEKIPALRLDLSIQRIETRSADRGQLRPHRRFRSGSVWLSADARRLPLRAEVSLFIGFVYAELVSWQKL